MNPRKPTRPPTRTELEKHRDHLEKLVAERTSQLEAAKAQIEAVVQNLNEGVVVADLDGRVVQWNRAALDMHGFGAIQEAQRQLADFANVFEVSTIEGIVLPVEQWPLARILRDEKLHDLELRVRRLPNGWQRVFSYGGMLVRDALNQPLLALVTLSDITARRKAEEALRASEARYRSYLEVTDQVAWTTDANGMVVDDLPAWTQYTGQSREEMHGWGWTKAVHPEDVQRTAEIWRNAVAGKKSYETEYRLRRHDGVYRDFLARGVPSLREDGGIREWVGICIDITARKRAEEELRRMNRTLRAQGKSNHALMHAQAETELLEEVCRIIVNDCGHALAWIGYAEEDAAKSIRPVAWAGFEAGYLETLRLTWADTGRGRGPTGTAIRTAKPSMCRNMLTDPMFAPWRKDALKRGYAASIALPLMAEGRAFGALTLYSRQPDPFAEDEVKLLGELASDLAYGISTLRLRQAHDQAQAKLAYLASFPERNPNPLMEIDAASGGVVYLNPVARRLFPDLEAKTTTHPFLAGLPAAMEALGHDHSLSMRCEAMVDGACYTQAISSVPGGGRVRVYAIDITERKRAEEAVQASEERFRGLVEQAADGIFVSNAQGHYVDVNSAGAEMFGYTREEVLQLRIADVVTAEEALHLPGEVAKFAGGQVVRSEWQFRRKDGSRFPGEVAGRQLPDGRLQAIVRDITERKQTEETLRFLVHCGAMGANGDFFQELASYLARSLGMDFVCIDRLEAGLLAASTLAVFHNGKFEDNVSYTLKDTPCGDVVGKTICCFPRNVRGLFPKDAVLQDLQAESYLGVTLWSSQGKPIGLIAVIGRQALADSRQAESLLQLVAVRAAGELERQQAEEALRRSEARYRAIGESIDYGVWVCDADGRNTYASESFLKLVGLTQEQCSNFGWSDVLHPDDAQRTIAAWKECSRTGGVWDIEHRFRGVDGRYHPVLARGVPVKNERGEIVCWAGINLDISRRKAVETALSELSQRLTYHVDHSPLAVIEWGPDMRLIRWSGDAEHIFGWKAEEVLGKRMEDLRWLYVDDERQRAEEAAGRSSGSAPRRFSTSRNYRKDGSIIHCEWYNSSLLDESGWLRSILSLVLDVTERKQAERALQESEERLRLAQQAGRVGTFERDLRTQRTVWSAELEAIYGLPPGGFDGTFGSWQKLIHPDDLPRLNEQLQSAVVHGAHFQFEYRILRPDGEVRWLQAAGKAVYDERGEPIRTLGASIDVTERKRAEQRLDLLAETAGELLRTDSPQRVVDNLCRRVMAFLDCQVFFNFLADETKGRLRLNACGGISDEERGQIEWIDYGACACSCAARDGCHGVAENIRETPDPRMELVKALGIQAYACHPLLGQQGKVLGTLSFGTRSRIRFTDEELSLMKAVADHVSIAMERQRAADVIRALNADLEQRVRHRTAELEASNKELEAFCYSVSHDLRAPLRGIDGFSQALLEDHADKLDADGLQDLQWIRSECQKLGHLIDDLLTLSRLTRSAMARERVDLSELARQIAANLQQTAPERTVQFGIAEGLSVEGDPQLLLVALSNLLENAWKYTGQRPDALIELGTLGSSEKSGGEPVTGEGASPAARLMPPVFFVRDNGVGFDMAYADKLFTPFQRLHSAKEFPGTGIGLATVHRVIHRHGGHIWVQAAVGQGATFFFTLRETNAE